MASEQINLQYTTIKDQLPDFIYQGLQEFSMNSNGYKPQPEELIEKISTKFGVASDYVYLLAGADEGIQTFARLYGNDSYVFTPTYTVYSDVKTFGGKLTEVYSIKNNKFEIDSKTIPNASLIYLANPNNPSGFTTKDKAIELIKNNSSSIVVIDEAYGDFAPELSVMDQIEKYKNLAVLRSFSKGYGMAGNRIGFVVANPEIISKVRDFTQWANVSYLSVGAAMVALDHEDYFKKMREEVAIRRAKFMKLLSDNDFSILPSKINAVVIQFDGEQSGTKFFEYLGSNNIVVSHGNGSSNIGLNKSFVRIAIGTEEQMNVVGKIIGTYKK